MTTETSTLPPAILSNGCVYQYSNPQGYRVAPANSHAIDLAEEARKMGLTVPPIDPQYSGSVYRRSDLRWTLEPASMSFELCKEFERQKFIEVWMNDGGFPDEHTIEGVLVQEIGGEIRRYHPVEGYSSCIRIPSAPLPPHKKWAEEILLNTYGSWEEVFKEGRRLALLDEKQRALQQRAYNAAAEERREERRRYLARYFGVSIPE